MVRKRTSERIRVYVVCNRSKYSKIPSVLTRGNQEIRRKKGSENRLAGGISLKIQTKIQHKKEMVNVLKIREIGILDFARNICYICSRQKRCECS